MFNAVLLEHNDKNKEVDKLQDYLSYKQYLTINQREMTEIWEILIKRVESVENDQFFDGKFKEISEKILKLCDDHTKDNYQEVLTEAFTEILINFEMSSDIVSSFVKKFKKCGKKNFQKLLRMEKVKLIYRTIMLCMKEMKRMKELQIKGELPEYMKRMLIITGFAGNEQYMEDTTNHLLSLVVIHYGNYFVKLLQILGEKMKNYREEGKTLHSEFSKTSIEDVGIYTQITNEIGGKLNELNKNKEEIFERMKKKTGTEEEEILRNELKMLEEDEKNLKIKFNELLMKNRLKSDIREHEGNFRIRKRKLGNNEVAIMKLQNEQENLDKEVKLIENELEKLDEEIKATEEEHLKDIKLKIEEKEKSKTEKNEKLKEIADKISALINGEEKELTEEEENRLNLEEEKRVKLEEEQKLKLTELKEIVKNEEKPFLEKNSKILKIENLSKFDEDKYGLLSFFKSNEFKINCYGETEKENEIEKKLDVLEYEYKDKLYNQNKLKTNFFLIIHEKTIIDKKFNEFESLFNGKYQPQSKVEKKKDFHTVKDWLNGRNSNSIENRISLLKKNFVLKVVSKPKPKQILNRMEKIKGHWFDKGRKNSKFLKSKSMNEKILKKNPSLRLKRKGVTKSASFPDNDERNKVKLD
uniref:Uncharacterized protein n=1 Tax=Meloidogyne enterolobii TaxID=390850 RepID=A0A6V7TV86_MELEN|nr:unnamed protein product [Meloidogyne enterolobii]